MSAPPPDPALFKPVVSGFARWQVVLLGAVVMLLGVIAALSGMWEIGLVFLAWGGLFSGLAVYTRRTSAAAQLLNRAHDTMARGLLADADVLLDRAQKATRAGYLLRVVDLQRALIALRRGKLAPALEHADAAVARRLGIFSRGQELLQLARAHAVRALLRAASGDDHGAREDADFVRASREAPPAELARAELATAVVVERSGDREALRRHLTSARTLLLEHTAPRERAVVRAYQRMLETRRVSVYRESAAREPERSAGDEPTVADWMAAVVPAAAPFARAARPAPDTTTRAPEPAETLDPEARRAAEARLRPKGLLRGVLRLLGIWAALIGVFLTIWQFLAAAGPGAPQVEPEATPPTALIGLLPYLVVGGVLLVIVALRAHGHRQAQRLFAALRAIAADDEARGEAELRALSKSRYPIVAGAAWRELATLSEQRADFPAALAACDHAVKAVSRSAAARAMATYSLLPELVAERAFVLAATDRDAEAGAEMALLQERYPSHAHRARAELRVGLVRRVRRGDLAGAAALCAQGTEDVPLALRDEALADMVRAVVHPESAGAGEMERLRRELRLDARLSAWLDEVAPAVTAAFAAAEHGSEVAPAEAERDAAAEHEAAAEQEAEAMVAVAAKQLDR